MLTIVKIDDTKANIVHEIQRASFLPLLKKYQDIMTNPASETVEIIKEKMNRNQTDSYLFKEDNQNVGWVRIQEIDKRVYCVKALCVLPDYQGRKIAQKAMTEIESYYDRPCKWVLDTILQEKGNVHLYEKLGYQRVGIPKHINEMMDLIDFEKLIQ